MAKAKELPNVKVLQIGNYPPPACGWAMQIKFLVEEIRSRGIVCDVLNLNENRTKKSREYVDVQNGMDYLLKLIRFAFQGYRFQVHVNGQSKTGYLLALIAAAIGRLARRPVALSWRGGLHQKYFPRPQGYLLRWPFQLLFRMAGQISCNNSQVKLAIESYGIEPSRVTAIPGFSRQHMAFQHTALSGDIEGFLRNHHPVFFCYVSYRPEYQLPVLREAMQRFQQTYPKAGFIWLGFPSKEMPAAREYIGAWPASERDHLLILGNLSHDAFLTLLSRCFAYVRTPACDGVSSSILEALSLGIPVVASENGDRPQSVVCYREGNADDLYEKLVLVTERYQQIKEQTQFHGAENNIARTADWVLEESSGKANELAQDFASAD